VTNDTQLLAFKLNRQDGLNLIASDEVRATREAAAVKVAEPQKERGMERAKQISRGDMSL
jgi:hypothetical protein